LKSRQNILIYRLIFKTPPPVYQVLCKYYKMLCHEHRRAGFPIASLLLGTSNSNHPALSCHEKYDFENGTRKHTEESKNKMLQSLQSRDYSGDKNPFFGKKHTEESKNKMRQNMPDCSGDSRLSRRCVRIYRTYQVIKIRSLTKSIRSKRDS
jgi:NUMOD3 motif-containing protein